jgi:hypothetical protein
MLAVLLFVTTIAMGQNSQLPFPQAANPALQEGTYAPVVVFTPQNTPSSMAANVGGTTAAPMIAYRGDDIDNGSPFPTAANPSLGAGTNMENPSLEERRHKADSGSPFPAAADPSSTNW